MFLVAKSVREEDGMYCVVCVCMTVVDVARWAPFTLQQLCLRALYTVVLLLPLMIGNILFQTSPPSQQWFNKTNGVEMNIN